MTFSYDEDADVMYVTFSKTPSRVTYLENDNGDILRFNEATREIVGITIPSFKVRIEQGEKLEIPEIGIIPFNPGMGKLISSRTANVKNREKTASR